MAVVDASEDINFEARGAESEIRREQRAEVPPLHLRLRGQVGELSSERDLRSPREMRHPFSSAPDQRLEVDLGMWARRVGIEGLRFESSERSDGAQYVSASRTTGPSIWASGGPLVMLGASCQQERRFSARLGYEIAPLSWLLVGVFGEVDSARAGGDALLEAALPTTWAVSWILGIGPGLTVDYDGRAEATVQLQVTLQFPIVGLNFQVALGRDGPRSLLAAQISI